MILGHEYGIPLRTEHFNIENQPAEPANWAPFKVKNLTKKGFFKLATQHQLRKKVKNNKDCMSRLNCWVPSLA